MANWRKTASEIKDYVFDWSDWLTEGDTLTSVDLTAADGLIADSPAPEITGDGTTVTLWISGGEAVHDYPITCTVETAQGRTAERTKLIRVTERLP